MKFCQIGKKLLERMQVQHFICHNKGLDCCVDFCCGGKICGKDCCEYSAQLGLMCGHQNQMVGNKKQRKDWDKALVTLAKHQEKCKSCT